MVSTMLVKQKRFKKEFPKESPRFQPNPPNRREAFDGFIKNTLKLAPEQEVEFRKAHKEYFWKNRVIRDQLRKHEEEFIEAMTSEPQDTILLEELVQEIGLATAQQKRILYQHYENLEEICTDTQLLHMDSLMHTFSRNDREKVNDRSHHRKHQ